MRDNKDIEREKNELNAAKLVEFEATDVEKAFIDGYLTNGFNQVQAVLKAKPGISYQSAKTWGSEAMNRERVKLYLKKRQAILKQETNVDQVHILRELLSFAYSDVTAFIGLSHEELRELPPDIKRCIASIETNEKTYLNSDRKLVKEVSTKVKLVDKLKAIDMISKHINFYDADNKSKAGTIDLSSATSEQLNVIMDLVTQQEQQNRLKQ